MVAKSPIEKNLKLEVATKNEIKEREKRGVTVKKSIERFPCQGTLGESSPLEKPKHTPGSSHFDAVYRIQGYLKGSATDRRSTSEYCSFVGGNLVTWQSKKQSMVARSSAKAKAEDCWKN
ncbi:putative mitochondrial protein [Cucumis melo var. makuwa]|uniref:Putative mitochondrial protein n=1 Tax=Cucumis melo var. makuwa TaxID=1194695 RepID=A0A5D3BMM9_CUCMM|nr:putative mitochondrial protein [Cucumis melo var. makuwa]